VKGVLEKSLYNQVLIELDLEERLDAVANPWNVILETEESSPQPLPEGTKVIDIFDQIGAGRTLLILGEPGAGKTTTLLELTRDLIARAEQDVNHLVPVIFNLSSWAVKRQKIADWLVEELNTKYQVPKKIGQPWLEQQQLLPLLDGLDEVKAEYREQCLDALNAFHQEYGSELVVCSRIKDYNALSNRLNFQSAVYIRSLTLEQASHYLSSVSSNFTGLRALIKEDTALQELASSPLMLNIMVLAYEGVAVEDLPRTEVVEEGRKQLFDTYIEKMFKRREANQRYSKAQVKRWLNWLAKRLYQESQSVFFIERMQPSLLSTTRQKWMYFINVGLIWGVSIGLIAGLSTNALLVGLIIGLAFGVIKGLIHQLRFFLEHIPSSRWQATLQNGIYAIEVGLNFGLGHGLIIGLINSDWKIGAIAGLIVWLITGLILGLIIAPFWGLSRVSRYTINPVETLKWSWTSARDNMIFGLIGGMIGGLSIGLMGGFGGFNGLLIGALSGGLIGLGGGLIGPGIKTRTIPNQGIWQSAKITIIFVLGAVLWLGLIFKLIGLPISLGIIHGLFFGPTSRAGEACLKHFILRVVFYSTGCNPWNYARFLDYATEHIFLQKVGGGYIFIHRLLLEHFAQMEFER
jgi:DNA polymerase III delta prime subunit